MSYENFVNGPLTERSRTVRCPVGRELIRVGVDTSEGRALQEILTSGLTHQQVAKVVTQESGERVTRAAIQRHAARINGGCNATVSNCCACPEALLPGASA